MRIIEPTQKQIDETWAEIEQMANRSLKARRRLEFLKRPDTVVNESGELFVIEDGKLVPVEGDL